MQKNTLARDLTSGNIVVQLLCFIAPLFLSNVLQTVYNVVDMAIVGHYVGNAGLSAVSVCGEAINILTFIAMGFSNAGQVLISQYTGGNRPDKVQKLIGNLFSVLALAAVILTVFSLLFHNAILDFVNIPNEARADAEVYLLTCAAGLLFTYGYNVVSAILRGMGDSKHPFVFIALASVLNVGLDILLVAGFGMGVFGAALATVVSQGISFISSIVFLRRNRDNFGFDFKPSSFAIRREAVIPLMKLGIPMAMQSGLIQASKLLVTRWINDYGVNISALTGIGNKFNSIGVTFSSAVSTSAAAMIGQCIGAKKYSRVVKTVCISGLLSVSIATVLNAAVLLFPNAVFSIFTTDAEVLAMTDVYVPVIVVMLYSSSFRAPMNGLINGSGNSKMNFLVAVTDSLVGHIGLAALFGFALGYGINGLWYGNASAGFTPFFIGLIYCISGKWKVDKSWAEK